MFLISKIIVRKKELNTFYCKYNMSSISESLKRKRNVIEKVFTESSKRRKIEKEVKDDDKMLNRKTVEKELTEGKICFYDTETTSIHPKCGGRVCEFAGMLVENGKPKKTMHVYLNPDTKSWDGAYKAHGLSEPFLRAQTPFTNVAGEIKSFLSESIRCAHNGRKFDDNYINHELMRANVFEKFKELLSPGAKASASTKKGNAKLRKHKIIYPKTNIINLDQEANYLTNATMIYFFRDYFKQDTINGKIGTKMFVGKRILPDPEKNPLNYEAALLRLAYFRLIRIQTDTQEQRKKLTLPLVKTVKDAVDRAEKYIKAVIDIFESKVLKESEYNCDIINRNDMFDTYEFARENDEIFVRNASIDNLKLDGLIDYYGINRYEREAGKHGAGIDTDLLFQVTKKMFGVKEGSEANAPLFKKNSLIEFGEKGEIIKTTLLHNDRICEEFGDPGVMLIRRSIYPSLSFQK